MPVYVYRNLVTNETFEHQQRITEDALTVDPRTGDPVRRVIQPVGIAFKGSGFYVNDSRSSSGATSSSAKPSGAESSSGGESTGGSDSSGGSESSGATEATSAPKATSPEKKATSTASPASAV